MTGAGGPARLRIATRESALALWQAHHVQGLLQARYPSCLIEIIGMTTRGDQILDRSLSAVGGKGLFTKELEAALLADQADLAVHSLKDVPMDLDPSFTLAAILKRDDPRDAFVSNQFASVAQLPAGARVGTASLRRAAQLMAQFPHLQIVALRGNVNTRLSKLDQGQYDAIVLAAAGLKRLGMPNRIRQIMPPTLSLPAAGQGALALETLTARVDLRGWMQSLAHLPSTWASCAERAVSRRLGGSCRAPLAAYCEPDGREPDGTDRMSLRALAASVDGKRVLQASGSAPVHDVASATALGTQVAEQLVAQGAIELLADSA